MKTAIEKRLRFAELTFPRLNYKNEQEVPFMFTFTFKWSTAGYMYKKAIRDYKNGSFNPPTESGKYFELYQQYYGKEKKRNIFSVKWLDNALELLENEQLKMIDDLPF